MGYTVVLTRAARRALEKAPKHIVTRLLGWVDLIETDGLEEARKIPGYRRSAGGSQA